MIIRRLTIRDFGAVSFYETALTPELNMINSRYTQEISAAIGFFALQQGKAGNSFRLASVKHMPEGRVFL